MGTLDTLMDWLGSDTTVNRTAEAAGVALYAVPAAQTPRLAHVTAAVSGGSGVVPEPPLTAAVAEAQIGVVFSRRDTERPTGAVRSASWWDVKHRNRLREVLDMDPAAIVEAAAAVSDSAWDLWPVARYGLGQLKVHQANALVAKIAAWPNPQEGVALAEALLGRGFLSDRQHLALWKAFRSAAFRSKFISSRAVPAKVFRVAARGHDDSVYDESWTSTATISDLLSKALELHAPVSEPHYSAPGSAFDFGAQTTMSQTTLQQRLGEADPCSRAWWDLVHGLDFQRVRATPAAELDKLLASGRALGLWEIVAIADQAFYLSAERLPELARRIAAIEHWRDREVLFDWVLPLLGITEEILMIAWRACPGAWIREEHIVYHSELSQSTLVALLAETDDTDYTCYRGASVQNINPEDFEPIPEQLADALAKRTVS